MDAPTELAFWPHKSDLNTASYRVRCALVVEGLRRLGLPSRIYRPGDAPPPVLVLSKRYDPASVSHANALRASAGTRWLLDVCDNHFHVPADEPGTGWFRARAAQIAAAVEAADGVVAASEALRQEIARRCPSAPRITVIEDAVDEATRTPSGRRSAGDAAQRLRQRLFFLLNRPRPGRRLVWFGNHGYGHAEGGMSDLAALGEVLERHHAEAPLTLTVVSNSREKYRRLRATWRFASTYRPWSVGSFAELLSMHDVALVPVQANPVTVCKTSNRLVTAFSRGVAVAAGSIPSYEPFRGIAVLDDWEGGLATLMDDPDERAARIARAHSLIAARYAVDVIGRQWVALGRRVAAQRDGAPCERELRT